MTKLFLFLDESGDLGWKLDKPYRDGGSSRFLTIAALVVPEQHVHAPARAMRKLYDKMNWPTDKEKKWARMLPEERIAFSEAARKIAEASSGEIKYLSITARKENVRQHIRSDPNKLYNFMIGLLLLKEMGKYDQVIMLTDDRSIKVRSGNSLFDYLQMELWMKMHVETVLKAQPCDSSKNLCVQFADMLSGIAQSHYEDRSSQPYRHLAKFFQPKLIYNNPERPY
ncbi:DUF3800 domain-containing protein [Pseudomonas sp. UBA6323]|uniref:DUF3800 domain-containing protein n=1 Tax=Pseudomonas sp. UBA6323 TaxID=1947329 RepID=UPI0025EEF31C|nr:DUF3800 domain-containing protein [Pseudomonas sp. UBA6323]